MEGILMSGLQEAKYQISEADWEFIFFCIVVVVVVVVCSSFSA